MIRSEPDPIRPIDTPSCRSGGKPKQRNISIRSEISQFIIYFLIEILPRSDILVRKLIIVQLIFNLF
jgi:hypothetical protein